MSSDDLLSRLESLGITARTASHPPLFTVEESKRLRGELPGGHVKNLFLRDKRGQHWLLTTLEDSKVDLKEMARRLDAGKFSFASHDALAELLGIAPGAVSPLAVVNDVEGRVNVVLDEALLAHDPLNVHPLRNDRTTALAPSDLVRFLADCGHPPKILPFAAAS
jgi:Ala-tRNA(Pro) deacylase